MTDQVPAYMRGLHIDPGFRTTEEAYEYLKQCFPVGRSTNGAKAVTGEPYVTIINEVGPKPAGDPAHSYDTASAAWQAFWEGLYRYAESKLSVREDCKLYFRVLPTASQNDDDERYIVRARLLLSAEPELTEGGMKYAAIEPHPPIKPGDPINPPRATEVETGLEETVQSLGRRLHDRVGALKLKGHDPRCISIALTKIEEAGLWIQQAKKKGTFF